MTENPRHLSLSNEHYTPERICKAVRATMGGIDLDPASCQEANGWVRAERFFDQGDDGLSKEWFGKVFLNPPGGKVKGKSSQKIWWATLVEEWFSGRVEQAVFLSFSLEFLQTSQVQATGPLPIEFPFCVPSRRIAYVKPGGEVGESPPHASAIFYLPTRVERDNAVMRFLAYFSPIGACGNCGIAPR
jgi:hypothetical protein